ncbi:MAG: phage minor capsid protein, partial [Smithellaceae bacterium]
KLLDQIGGGDFIIVNGKSYNVKSYAELVARTRMRESQTQATIELANEFENDLAEIPRHDNPCEEICAEYQGKVYSISGKHPDYPMLPDGGPPFHPRCECTLNLTSETALRWRNK